MEYSGNIVDIVKKRIFKGTVIIEDDLIIDILEKDNNITIEDHSKYLN